MGPTDLAFAHVDTGEDLHAWSDTECARELSGKRLPWADKEAERAYACIGPRWDIWYVIHGQDCSKAAWQARPIGAGTSVVSASTVDELISRVVAYVAELPKHIEAERAKLRAAEPEWQYHGYRQTHERRLEALLTLQSAMAKKAPV